jgi:ribonuclease T1
MTEHHNFSKKTTARRIALRSFTLFLLLLVFIFLHAQVYAQSCEQAVHALNVRLSPRIDESELVEVLHSLNSTNNKSLPQKFITKNEARSKGWRPGEDLWAVKALKGSSIGGDKFSNYEKQLPKKNWCEADLDYKGGHRGAKRIIFSTDGMRFVTVDHYKTFVEVPSCQ